MITNLLCIYQRPNHDGKRLWTSLVYGHAQCHLCIYQVLGGMALSTLRAKTVRTRTEERAPPRGKNECRHTRRH